MKQTTKLHACQQPVLLTLALLAAPALSAQTAPAPSPATLQRYDLNRNGQLDPNELAAQQADEARAAGAPTTNGPAAAPAAGEETITLSPFEVTEANTGYYASNTMSGTRLNTKLEDIGSSISVVTKQQMSDFGMLDINDIFNYEASTEGTGNYTAFEVDRNGQVSDQIQNNPQGANRIRGIGAANISLGNFATSGRMPVDPIAIDAIEISRGPNSSIFGIGEGSGTVNMVQASANFGRESTAVELRADDTGGWRTSLDMNRPLIANKLAVRFSTVYQHEEWNQKPSGLESRRFNAMVRYQPFKDTTIRGSFNSYHSVGTRPTAVTPRDGVSYWRANGSPAWDPVAATMTVNGVTTPFPYTAANGFVGTLPTGIAGMSFVDPGLFVDNSAGIQLWMVSREAGNTGTFSTVIGPSNTSGARRFLETAAEQQRTAGRPLFSTNPGISSQSLYNYADINLAAPNSIKDQIEISTVELEQFFLNTERNKIAVQLAWQREDADRVNRNVIGQSSATGNSYTLYVDPNQRLIDGRPNPYFGRPYIGAGEPVSSENPYVRDSFRAQAAYILNLENSDKWYKWLGRHQLLGYYEERKTETLNYRFRIAMTSDNPIYAPAGTPKGNQATTNGFGPSPTATRGYFRYYVGDNNGANVDYAPGTFDLGNYGFTWFDNSTGTYKTDQATLGRAAITEGVGGTSANLNLIKTKGLMLQNNLLQDRVIATWGWRNDENRNKNARPPVLKPNGYEYDYAAMDGWVGDWALNEGDTRTKGVVVKPFRNLPFTDRMRSSGGAQGYLGSVLSGMTVYYNESDSFRPADPAISVRLTQLPNPTSKGEDYGFTLNLSDKLVFRANRYETSQINSRAGQSAVLGQRVLRLDIQGFAGNSSDAFPLQRQATSWITAANPTFTPAQVSAAVANLMQLTPTQIAGYRDNQIAETQDAVSKGDEFELSYNPNSYWTLRANAARTEAIDSNMSPNIPAWISERLPVWESIIDPRGTNPGPDGLLNTPDDIVNAGSKWLDNTYTGDNYDSTLNPGAGNNPRRFLNDNVLNPLKLAQATEGKAKPQTRKWRFNMNTSYRLAGITENKYLSRMTVGGAVRWEDKGAIGYYGIPVNGVLEAATEYDPNRPIYDKEHYYFDAFASYSMRMFSDKVRARFQLNVKNIQESKAHLQAIGAYPNGQPHTFRIIDPRTFIFTASFDL